MKHFGWVLLLMTSLTTAQAQAAGLLQQLDSGRVNWTENWIEASGTGLAPADKQGTPQGKLLAQRAAEADAYRRLAETVNGVRVDAETTVRDFVVESDIIRTRVQGVIQGARPTGPHQLNPDGTTSVSLRMPLYGAQQLSGAIQLQNHVRQRVSRSQPSAISLAALLHKQPEPPFFPRQVASSQAGFVQLAQAQAFTGLVLDMCSAPLQPAMSPAVFGGQQQVYIGQFPIDPDQVVAEGVLQYFDDYGAALTSARVGSRPLIVEALGSNASQTDILVSPEDAARIQLADKSGKFLEKLRVVVATL